MMAQPNKKALLDQFGVTDDPNLPKPEQPIDGGIGASLAPSAPLAGALEAGALAPESPAVPPVAAVPDYRTLGDYASALSGYDMAKFARPYDEWSEKYKLGAVQSHFDPTKGITPEFLAAANTLGNADYSGTGDELSVANPRNGFRSAKGGAADVIQGLKSGKGRWTYWSDPALDTPQPTPRGGGVNFGGSSISPMLQGNAQEQIQQALAALTQQSPNLAALLQQLGR